MPELSESTLTLMTDWFRRVRESQQVHYACANHFSRLHLLLGIPTVLLSTVAGGTAFNSVAQKLQAQNNEILFVGTISILAAALASLQTFFNFSKRADDHRATAAKYAAARRRLEQLKTLPPEPELLRQDLDSIRKEMDALAESAPEVPERIKARVDARLKSQGHDGIYKLPPRAPARDRGGEQRA